MSYYFKSWRWLAYAAIVCFGLTSCDNDRVIVDELASEAEKTTADNPSRSTLTAADACEVADKFKMGSQRTEATNVSRSDVEIATIDGEDGIALAYIINYSDDGWVIVSATKKYYPILAYAETGRFSLDGQSDNDGLSIWVSEISQAIESSDSLDSGIASQIAIEWLKYEPQTLDSNDTVGGNTPEAIACRNRIKELNDLYYQEGWSFTNLTGASVTVPQEVYNTADQYSSPYQYTIIGVKNNTSEFNVDQLLTTEWHQMSDYNALCPNGYVGCVPLAMGQIMNFHQLPDYFDWSNMKDREATTATQQLLRQIGIDIEAKYNDGKTEATIDDAVKGFKKYLYTVTKKTHSASDVAHWMEAHRCPVYMRGEKSNGTGHAWVCDGVIGTRTQSVYYVEYAVNGSYDNLGLSTMTNPAQLGNISQTYTFHMNWGMVYFTGGSSPNGWFVDPELLNNYQYTNDRINLYVKPQ